MLPILVASSRLVWTFLLWAGSSGFGLLTTSAHASASSPRSLSSPADLPADTHTTISPASWSPPEDREDHEHEPRPYPPGLGFSPKDPLDVSSVSSPPAFFLGRQLVQPGPRAHSQPQPAEDLPLPIIGVLTQPVKESYPVVPAPVPQSYIAGSYFRWL